MPHRERDAALVVPADDPSDDTLNRFEHWLRAPVQAILLLFGFVNAGVPIAAAGIGTWTVLVAMVLGKPVGVLLFTAGAGVLGLRRPAGLSWGDVLVVGCAAGIGFTVALFFATAAFPAGPLLEQAKLGALLSIGSAALAYAVSRLRR
jgi:NhaA family Na+:H+ antiporter